MQSLCGCLSRFNQSPYPLSGRGFGGGGGFHGGGGGFHGGGGHFGGGHFGGGRQGWGAAVTLAGGYRRGTVIVGTGPAGMVEGMGVVGMVAVPTGGGVTPTRMLTDLTVGNSDKQKNPELQPRNSPG